jgi:hypothetical protein
MGDRIDRPRVNLYTRFTRGCKTETARQQRHHSAVYAFYAVCSGGVNVGTEGCRWIYSDDHPGQIFDRVAKSSRVQ